MCVNTCLTLSKNLAPHSLPGRSAVSYGKGETMAEVHPETASKGQEKPVVLW